MYTSDKRALRYVQSIDKTKERDRQQPALPWYKASCVLMSKKGRVHSLDPVNLLQAIVGLFPSPSNAISSFTQDKNTSIPFSNA